jgi:PTS system beta-glucosides-specific IIC component
MNFFSRRISERQKEQISIQQNDPPRADGVIKSDNSSLKIFSPTAGKIIPLNQVDDEVFKKDIVGKGIGIIPEIPAIYSPVDGVLKYIPTTNHAVIVASDDGLHVLVHVGLDTVNLKGQFFKMIAQKEERVKVGDLLLEFDMQALQKMGYNTVVPVVVTNTNDFSRIEVTHKEKIEVSDCLISVFK